MANWATNHIAQLQNGKTIQCRPHGSSMLPKIKSGQLLTISPDLKELAVGDVVLCKVRGNCFTHLITAIRDNQFQISNNKGHINGWIGIKSIYGRVVKIED